MSTRHTYRAKLPAPRVPQAVQAMTTAQTQYAKAQREYERLDAEQQVHAERTAAALVAAREAYAAMMRAAVKAEGGQ